MQAVVSKVYEPINTGGERSPPYRRTMNNSVKKYLSDLGKKGGAAGTGDKKRRGDPEYYRDMVKKRWEKSKHKPEPK